MILGIGNDVCNISRIDGLLQKFGRRFLSKVLSLPEQQALEARPKSLWASAVAKRFAAKEACAKALGSGIADGVYLRDLQITNAANGKPILALTGGAAKKLEQLTPPGMVAQLDISLSDDFPMAMAMVVISAHSPMISP